MTYTYCNMVFTHIKRKNIIKHQTNRVYALKYLKKYHPKKIFSKGLHTRINKEIVYLEDVTLLKHCILRGAHINIDDVIHYINYERYDILKMLFDLFHNYDIRVPWWLKSASLSDSYDSSHSYPKFQLVNIEFSLYITSLRMATFLERYFLVDLHNVQYPYMYTTDIKKYLNISL